MTNTSDHNSRNLQPFYYHSHSEMLAFSLSASSFFPNSKHLRSTSFQSQHIHYFHQPQTKTKTKSININLSAQVPDVVIIGAGVAGLSTAFELASRGTNVRVLTTTKRSPASMAAAGMLAPSSEQLPSPLQELSEFSRQMYPSFIKSLQSYVPGEDLGFVARNDFLLPFSQKDDISKYHSSSDPNFLTAQQLRTIEPMLGPNVIAAKRNPVDASVNGKSVVQALTTACKKLGVHIDQNTQISRIIASSTGNTVDGVQTITGDIIEATHYILASGAWTNKILPNIPIRPVKGQILSLSPPDSNQRTPLLNHVIYSHDVYIVPKNDDKEFYVGATVEEAGFTNYNTAGGIAKLLNAAINVIPEFAEYEIKETWTGLRPATPDLLPIFGLSEYSNLSLVCGYYRNGILLAPVGAQIAASVAMNDTANLPPLLKSALEALSYRRFLDRNNEPALTADESTQSQEQLNFGDPNIKPHLNKPKVPSQSTPPSRQMKDNEVDSNYAMKGIVKQHEQVPGVKIYEIQEDGTNTPVFPSSWTNEQITNARKKSTQKNGAVAEPTKTEKPEPGSSMGDKKNENDMFPPWWTPEQREMALNSVIPDKETIESYKKKANSSSSPRSDEQYSPVTAAKDEMSSFEYKREVENPQNVDANNNAYDDILMQQGVDVEKFMSDALAANRAFGRKKSYLEKEGSPVLSLSQEEAEMFDKARDEALKEAEELDSLFDPNHPSVVATRNEQKRIEEKQEQGGNDAVHAGGRITEESSSDGYF